jgi:hypothetical protein
LFANCSEPITGSELESRRPQNSVFNKNPDIPDGACHYGDINSREFVAVNGEFLRCAV